ncbi:hypothetical protein M3M33_14885, partial [Loigolactobacillus coryniformis]|uniref:hypothetical protein n=1 Tax=Loigolactobacillus coryniformis TaxID=1610 RepID=UPI00201A7FB0
STIEPRNLFAGYTTANTIRGLKLNTLIKEGLRGRKNVHVVEIADAFTDWAVKANYLPIIGSSTAVVSDGLHTSLRGAYIAGVVLRNH